jgi:hypothetical protein
MTLVRFNSHRARDKAEAIHSLGPCFYSWDTRSTGGFYRFPDSVISRILEIKGASKASQRFDYLECWH